MNAEYPCPIYRETHFHSGLEMAVERQGDGQGGMTAAENAHAGVAAAGGAPSVCVAGITVYAACPGSCATDMNPFGRHTTADGAATPAWLVTAARAAERQVLDVETADAILMLFFAILYDSVYVVGEACCFGSRNPITINGRCNTYCK